MRTWPALTVGQLARAGPDGPDLLQAALSDYPIAAVVESTPDTWQIFFATARDRDRTAAGLARQFPAFAFDRHDVADEDWVARSQADLRAVRVGDIVVAPPWDLPGADGFALEARHEFGAPPSRAPIVIIIRPSMGFGTAHHATTRLCLEALQGLDLHGASVVDVGTGSGVLALAASLLGATTVLGIDDDPDALEAARDNLSLNPGATVAFEERDARADASHASDLVLANLTGALLATAAPALLALAKPGGRLILSGLLEGEAAIVTDAFDGCAVHNRLQEGEWLCLSLQRP